MKQEINNKIASLRREFPLLSKEENDYIFNALVIQTLFYKNPSYPLDPKLLSEMIVDGKGDGGIDCILNDEESDFGDIVFIQSKYHESFPFEQIKAALDKMYGAYQQLSESKFSSFRQGVVSQYTKCNYDMEDNAKVHFVLVTSAPQGGVKLKSITNYFNTIIGDSSNMKLDVFFEKEVVDKIIEFDSLRRTVSAGTIIFDNSNNYLVYCENDNDNVDAIVINGSAWSIKQLYSMHHLALFSQNLRFFVKSKNIDSDIKKSIEAYKKKFWYKNNGITIICDKFDVSGKEVHLSNFSIINGGQTTTLLGLHDDINEKNDFYLPIKIIRAQGENEEKRQNFIFDIAIATNSQKAIKPSDLKSNEPEQVLFAQELRQKGIFYRTKRGEAIPSNYKEKDKNLDLPKASKLGLAGIYLMPGTARSKPSIIYSDDTSYYEGLFVKNRDNSASSIKDLLYVDNYFDTVFRKEYEGKTKQSKRVTFANNSRTLCLAYSGFLAKFMNGEFTEEQIRSICNLDYKDEKEVKKIQKILSDASKMKGILDKNSFDNKDILESNLYKIFSFVCKQGATLYDSVSAEESVDESSWLKKDSSFYRVLSYSFDDLVEEIEQDPETFNIFAK